MVNRKILFKEALETLNKYTKNNTIDISIIKNVTLETVFDVYLKYYGLQFGIPFSPSYEDVLSYVSKTCETSTHAVIILLNLKEIYPRLSGDLFMWSETEYKATLNNLKMCLRPIIDCVRGHDQPTLFFTFERDCFENENVGKVTYNGIADEMNLFIQNEFATKPYIRIIDTNKIIAQVGANHYYDKRGYYLNSALYSQDGCNALAFECAKEIYGITGQQKKCLILDCDNVLWGGILGEDGPNGIKLGQIYPGMAYYDFQREVIKLQHCGVLICLCSKNSENDVMQVLENHPDCLLRPEHIAAKRINLNNKADNIRELADELHIGLDSVVYMDDSYYEIGLVQKELPQVEAIYLNAQRPHEYADILKQCGMFEFITPITKEDKRRTDIYSEDTKRKEAKTIYTDIDSYHNYLETILTFRYAQDFDLPRLSQISHRTNQFNLTAKRYSEAQLHILCESESDSVILLSVEDRFGDMGIVGCVVIHYIKDAAFIEAFMLSCRVFGRNFEDVFLNQICKLAKQNHCDVVIGKYNQTEKNKRYENFYLDHQFISQRDSFAIRSDTIISFPDHFKEIRGI